jgi:hypothetical protein
MWGSCCSDPDGDLAIGVTDKNGDQLALGELTVATEQWSPRRLRNTMDLNVNAGYAVSDPLWLGLRVGYNQSAVPDYAVSATNLDFENAGVVLAARYKVKALEFGLTYQKFILFDGRSPTRRGAPRPTRTTTSRRPVLAGPCPAAPRSLGEPSTYAGAIASSASAWAHVPDGQDRRAVAILPRCSSSSSRRGAGRGSVARRRRLPGRRDAASTAMRPATDDSGPTGDDTGTPDLHAMGQRGGRRTCYLVDGAVTCGARTRRRARLCARTRGSSASLTLPIRAGSSPPRTRRACWGPEEYSENFVIGENYVEITTGNDHGCGISINTLAVCWGSNLEGQSNAPDGAMIAIDAGAFHTCGIHKSGNIECWGRSKAQPAMGLAFTSVSAGGSSACGITSNGTLDCWGEDKNVIAGFPSGAFEQVSVGGSHACALDAAGAIQCWGDDSDGQTDVPGGTYEQVSAGRSHVRITTAGKSCAGKQLRTDRPP